MALPEVVSIEQWQAASDALLAKEKAATRLLDELAAKRRRLPIVGLADVLVRDPVDDGPRRVAFQSFGDTTPDGCHHEWLGLVDDRDRDARVVRDIARLS
jgi:hypothetical protein